MQEEHGAPTVPIVVHPTDVLDAVLEKLKMHRVHRVYMVDKEMVPVGVIALKDILELLVNKDEEMKAKKVEAKTEPVSNKMPMSIL